MYASTRACVCGSGGGGGASGARDDGKNAFGKSDSAYDITFGVRAAKTKREIERDRPCGRGAVVRGRRVPRR